MAPLNLISGEKPFVCDSPDCGKRFAELSSLKKHKVTHTGKQYTVQSLYNIPGPEVIKLFSHSTLLSTKFQLLIKTKILTNEEVSCFKSQMLYLSCL